MLSPRFLATDKNGLRFFDIVIFVSTGTATRRLRRLSARPWAVRLSLFKRRTFLRELGSTREILFAIEENFTVDKRRINSRIDTEWMSVPDRDIRILTDVNR